MTEGNGQGPLAGWAIVVTNGVTLLGRKSMVDATGAARPALSPVFALQRAIVPTPRGTALVTQCQPFLALSSVTSLAIPSGAIVVPVEELSSDERKSLAEAAEEAEAMRQAISRGPSSIAMPPGGRGLVKP